MKPIKYKECNVVYGKDQEEYNSLPAFKDEKGEVITFWKMSISERFRVLVKGGVWLSIATFNKPITPTFMTTKKSDLFEKTQH